MKKLFGSLALAAMLATPAMAADMPVKVKAPPPPVVYNWSGIYMGFSIGYNWQDFDWNYRNSVLPNPAWSFDTDNWIFDGHGGAQVQWGQIVLGVEASYSVTSSRWADHICPNVTLTCQAKVHELFTAGARLGWSPVTYSNLLLYVAGGYAAGLAETRLYTLATGLERLTAHSNHWHHGWYAGGGFDWMVHKGSLVDVILGLEYRHVELDGATHCNFADAVFCTNPANANIVDLSPTMDILHARLTIKTHGWDIFYDPVVKAKN